MAKAGLGAAAAATQILHHGLGARNPWGKILGDLAALQGSLRRANMSLQQCLSFLSVVQELLRTLRWPRESLWPRFLSPWAFEKKPNPVIFGHIYPGNTVGEHSRWRHVPTDMSHGIFAVEMGEVKREDNNYVLDITEIDDMDPDADDNISAQHIEAPPTQPEPPDKKGTTCSYCGAQFPTPGKLK
jgi:hypothetical protein